MEEGKEGGIACANNPTLPRPGSLSDTCASGGVGISGVRRLRGIYVELLAVGQRLAGLPPTCSIKPFSLCPHMCESQMHA